MAFKMAKNHFYLENKQFLSEFLTRYAFLMSYLQDSLFGIASLSLKYF